MARIGTTLPRFFIETQAGSSAARWEFPALLALIGLAGKMIADNLRRAGLNNVLGVTGAINVQGEAVKKLDDIANETLVAVFRSSGLVCAMASEEMETPLSLQENLPLGPYLLLFDPLDGSSNTDVNMPLGTIFSVLRYQGDGGPPSDSAFLRKGTEQVAAGYLLYGSSTMLVVTSGRGVHGFTLDPGVGEYLLSHENIRIPAKGRVYAVNEGNTHKWADGMRRYVASLKESDKATGRPYVSRYSGCLAADVHRILLGGGIYLYPGETDKPEGKLRLLYEANPLAMVVEQAGGKAGTGRARMLDVEPTALHQRVPLLIGSADDVSQAEAFIQGPQQEGETDDEPCA